MDAYASFPNTYICLLCLKSAQLSKTNLLVGDDCHAALWIEDRLATSREGLT